VTGLALVWALATAVAFGTADFLGGVASRRVPVLPVVLLSQLVALVLLGVSAVVLTGPLTEEALVWGAAAGVAAGLAFLAYYRGLAVGRMGLVSTMTAVWSAVVPVAVGLTVGGERPAGIAVLGIGVALVAIVLLSSGPAEEDGSSLRPPDGFVVGQPGLVEGVGAGIGYGAFFVFIERAGEGSVAWPLSAAAGATVLVVGAIGLWQRTDLGSARRHLGPIAATGLFQALGGVAVVLAVREGLLSLVAVVAALSPLPTMLLARTLLAERLTVRHLAGVALALLGVALIAGA
jgi:drug/metabolite transporter (DMT)-like permease